MNFSSSIALSLFIMTLLSGCDLIETIAPCSDDHCRPPAESVSEIQALGVTIATPSSPFPETVDTNVRTRASDGEEFIFSNELNIFFSPAMIFDTEADPDSLLIDWADHPYAFTFSMEADGAFEMIKSMVPSNSFLFEGTAFSPVAITHDPPELVVFGNHILEVESMFPIRATHIEIWFRQERENEFSLMKRASLEELIAWNKYLQPAILDVNAVN